MSNKNWRDAIDNSSFGSNLAFREDIYEKALDMREVTRTLPLDEFTPQYTMGSISTLLQLALHHPVPKTVVEKLVSIGKLPKHDTITVRGVREWTQETVNKIQDVAQKDDTFAALVHYLYVQHCSRANPFFNLGTDDFLKYEPAAKVPLFSMEDINNVVGSIKFLKPEKSALRSKKPASKKKPSKKRKHG